MGFSDNIKAAVKALEGFIEEHKDSGLLQNELVAIHRSWDEEKGTNRDSKAVDHVEQYKKFLDDNKESILSREQLLEVFKSHYEMRKKLKRSDDENDEVEPEIQIEFSMNKDDPFEDSLEKYKKEIEKQITARSSVGINMEIIRMMERQREQEKEISGPKEHQFYEVLKGIEKKMLEMSQKKNLDHDLPGGR